MIRIYCEAADAVLKETQTLTAGMTNYPECVLTFSDDWDGFGKAVVVKAGEVEKSVLVVNNKFTVPHECLAESGVNLIVGVSGTNGVQTIPTIWCSCGTIMDSVDIDESAGTGTATPSLVDQMIAYAQQVSDYAADIDQNVIRSVVANNVNADKYGVASVGISDTGASANRTLTFTFANLKGRGIEEMIFIPDGTNKNRLQIKFSDNTYLNYDGIKEAIASIGSTESAIEAAEALRVTAEQLRVSAEEARATAETARTGAESQRASAEEQRVSSESTRDLNENTRISNESSRASAETARASAESARATAEAGRVAAEETREDNETDRQSAESSRVSAEADRVSEESTRQSNEASRISAENVRVSAEAARSQAETNRAAAEQNRASAETLRETAETTRSSNETTRQSNESGRVSAESGRVSAETERAEAETQRQTGYSRLLTEFEEVKNTVDAFDGKLLDVYPVVNASGAIASFSDGADNLPVESLVVNIEPVQSGTGDPSPTNIRPITGWTGATISHSGADMSDPETLNITFPSEAGTVYGGTLDVTNGVLTVDHKYIEENGTANWNRNQDGSFYLTDSRVGDVSSSYTSKTKCNYFNIVVSSSTSYLHIWVRQTSGGMINILGGDVATIFPSTEALKTAFSTTPLQIIIPIATPITYTLTPTEVATLLGTNNIWADTGDTSVDYRADIKLYIDKKIAEAATS